MHQQSTVSSYLGCWRSADGGPWAAQQESATSSAAPVSSSLLIPSVLVPPIKGADQTLDRGWAEGKASLAIARGGRLGAMQVGHEPSGSMLMSVTIVGCNHVHPCVFHCVCGPSTVIQDVDVVFVKHRLSQQLDRGHSKPHSITTCRSIPLQVLGAFCECQASLSLELRDRFEKQGTRGSPTWACVTTVLHHISALSS